MNKLITILARLPFWRFVIIFTVLAIIISEILMMIQSYWLTGSFFDTNLLIVGFITPAVDAFLVFTLTAYIIQYLIKIQKQLEKAKIELTNEKEKAESLMIEQKNLLSFV